MRFTARMLDRVGQREVGAPVVARGEAAVHVAGADAQLEHHGRAARLRQLETLLDGGDDRRQVRPRVEQPDLRLHREGVRALLHDARSFAVVFADDEQRAAGDAARRQVGERVGRHVRADGGLERDGAAQRIVDRRGQRRRRRRLRRAVLEVHAQLGEHVAGVGQHVHQVRDRRALVAGDVGDARLQQRLRHGEDALAAEFVAVAQAQLGDFRRERAFGHGRGRERGTDSMHRPARLRNGLSEWPAFIS
jgi:hypothetical protein